MTNPYSIPLTLDDADTRTLARLLVDSPTATGDHGRAAVRLLTDMADGTILDNKHIRQAFTLDRGQVYIDWAMIAKLGKSLIEDRRSINYANPVHPDTGIALVMADALANRRLTESGFLALRSALINTVGE
jgi:hypothetical protein